MTSSSQIEQSQPCQLCGQSVVRANRILQEAVAQSSCLGRLIRTHVELDIVRAEPTVSVPQALRKRSTDSGTISV